jgi:quinoprotein glucose dehydrogenase
VPGPRGLPLLKPPFSSIVAIDMNTGEHRWRIPVGRSSAMPATARLNLSENHGLPTRSFALVTKTVMIVVQMGFLGPARQLPGVYAPIMDLRNVDPHLWVYDKTTGEKLAEIALPSNAGGAPISYMAGGKQYVAFPVGGGPVPEELIAVGL